MSGGYHPWSKFNAHRWSNLNARRQALPHIGLASPQTRVVMVTGNATRQVVAEAVAGGAKGYFLKPVRPAKVEEFMRKLLRI